MLVQMFTLSLLFAIGTGKKVQESAAWCRIALRCVLVHQFFLHSEGRVEYLHQSIWFNHLHFLLSAVLSTGCSLILPVQELQRLPMFWYVTSNLVYNAGTLFLLLFTTYLVEVLHNDLLIYWSFHNILDIIQDLLIMLGLWQDLRNIRLHS